MVKTSEGIKSIININTTEIESINCFNINIIEETFAFVVSSFFNRFVTTIAKKKKKKIWHCLHKSYTDYLSNPLEKFLYLTPASSDKIGDIIKTLSLRISIGPYNIPVKIFKKYSKTISIPIPKPINQYFVTGIFPEPSKLLSVIPISKKADPEESTSC